MQAYVVDWLSLLLRWLHLIAGVAWIGASFYFVMLDNSLTRPKRDEDDRRGVHGELWAVHGGGFYLSQKFLAGPIGEPLSERLHWSKWEAYTTWLSGIGLLALIYWFGATTYLIDRGVRALAPGEAVAISAAVLVGGWLVYDALCRMLAGRDGWLAIAVLGLVSASTWALFQVFSARAAALHAGAMLGTLMSANVLFHIIPGHKRMVAAIRACQAPSPRDGQIGKQRSVHNTYFTLPVLFAMISNHYPMTYSRAHGWLVLVLFMLAGALIRQFFVLRHRQRSRPALVLGAIALLAGIAIWISPSRSSVTQADRLVPLAAVQAVLAERCVSCHSAQPARQSGFAQPPKGVLLETPEQIAQHRTKIVETVANRYMPIGNLTGMTDDERALIAAWATQGAPTNREGRN